MRNLTIRSRIILLILSAVLCSLVVGGAFLHQLLQLRDFATTHTQETMLEGQKDKVKTSVHAMAVALGEVLAAMPEDKEARTEAIRRLVKPIRFEADQSGYFFVYQGTVNVALPIKPEAQGQDLGPTQDKNGLFFVRELAQKAKEGGGFLTWVFAKPGQGEVPKLGYAELIPGTDIWIGTGVYIDNIEARKAAIDTSVTGMVRGAVLRIGLGVTALFLFVILPLSFLIFRSIVRPLGEAAKAAQSVADGDLSVSLAVAGRDEIAHLETSLNTMISTLGRNMDLIRAKTREAEDKARAAEQATAEAQEARNAAERAKRDGLLAAAGRLEDVVRHLSAASGRIADQARNMSASTELQKERITQTATAMEEMNATVLEVARNATQASQGAATAKSQAEDGEKIVAGSVTSMESLLKLSGELKSNMDDLGRRAAGISQVMNVINDIADQTNLLALNAAIEAARAGEAGRGFAVVADEVRKLAEKTMTATKEVGETIQGIQTVSGLNIKGMDRAAQAIAESTGLVRQSGDVLVEIVRMSEDTALQVQSIATAAEEQSAASEEINRSVEEVNNIASANAAGMAQASAAIQDLAAQAERLRALVADLKREGA